MSVGFGLGFGVVAGGGIRSLTRDSRCGVSATFSPRLLRTRLRTSDGVTPADPATPPSPATGVPAARDRPRRRGRRSRGSIPTSVWRSGALFRRREFRRGRNGGVRGRSGGRGRGVGIRLACGGGLVWNNCCSTSARPGGRERSESFGFSYQKSR